MPEVDEDEYQGYHRFINDEGEEYGSFEVVWLTAPDECDTTGWHWAAGLPGCLWDGDPDGPYETSDAAYHAARGE